MLDIYKTTISERRNILKEIQDIVVFEHGYMSDESMKNYELWVVGSCQLYQVRLKEYKRLKYIRGNDNKDRNEIDGGDIWRNCLGIVSERELDMALASIVCSRLMELKNINVNEIFTLGFIKNFHKALYNDIFLWAGRIRDAEMTNEEPLLNHININFINYEKIYVNLNDILSQIANLDDKREKDICYNLSYFCSFLYYIKPFFKGNLLIAIYIVLEWSKKHDFGITISKINKYSKNMYLQRCIVLGSYSIANKSKLSNNVFNKNLEYLTDFFYQIHNEK